MLGDNRPFCIAILAAFLEHVNDNIINTAIDTMNRHRPDYAQIKANITLNQAMTFEGGLYIANMHPA